MPHLRSRLATSSVGVVIGLTFIGVTTWISVWLGYGPPIELALAGLAILLASIQFVDSKRQERKMEEIVSSMSTQYIGAFPKNLENVAAVVRGARRELLILTDFVAYGHYSSPRAFEEYKKEIRDAHARTVTVSMLVYDSTLGIKTLANQFRDDHFAQVSADKKFAAYFEKYAGLNKPSNAQGLRDLLAHQELKFTTELLDLGVDIAHLGTAQLVFFWVQDEEEAVFAFQPRGEATSYCFRTRDPKLIESFRTVFERQLSTSSTPGVELTVASLAAPSS
jgi:hypothetical protein